MRVPLGTIARFCTWAIFAIGTLQIAQYCEILLFKTDQHLDTIYTVGVPTVNVLATFVCLGLGVVGMYATHKLEEGEKGLRWTI